MSSIGPQGFLTYARFRYLKLAVLVSVLAVTGYIIDDPVGRPGGSTWLGYGLGGISSALMLWLLWYGVRRRSHRAMTPLRGWLSGHVYLGAALLLMVPLHSGFQFGWNVHTLSYALLCATSLSGLIAVIFYTQIPRRITSNAPGQKIDALLEEIADVDAECRLEVVSLPDQFAQAVLISITGTRIGGGLRSQFRLEEPNSGTRQAIRIIGRQEHTLDPLARESVRRLLKLLSMKQGLLRTVRRDMRYKAMLGIWMLLHVPLSLATAAAVFIHIFSVFYYV